MDNLNCDWYISEEPQERKSYCAKKHTSIFDCFLCDENKEDTPYEPRDYYGMSDE